MVLNAFLSSVVSSLDSSVSVGSTCDSLKFMYSCYLFSLNMVEWRVANWLMSAKNKRLIDVKNKHPNVGCVNSVETS